MTAEAIQIVASIKITNGNFKLPKAGGPILKVDQNTPGGGVPGSVVATAAGNNLDLSALSAVGWARLENVEDDGGTDVIWGVWDGSTFHPCGRMLPGEPALLRMESGVTYRIQGDGADANCFIQANED